MELELKSLFKHVSKYADQHILIEHYITTIACAVETIRSRRFVYI